MGNNASGKKLNILLLIAFVLGVAYMLYSAVYWTGAVSNASGTEGLGAMIASRIVMPHLVVTGVGVIFNGLGLFMKKPAFALVAGILYAVAMVLFMTYFMFVVIQAVLCFVAFAQMKKAEGSSTTAS
ncbi:MAG: hypothetical protein IJ125_09415 [Atopobiaceae bacterium]|nr:hypothetical protein [Atopobiaceae bacterium]